MRSMMVMLGALLMAASSGAAAQEREAAPSPIAPLAIDFTQKGLTGPGAAAIRAAIPDAQFIMVGEDHGFAGAPRMLAALAAESRDHGFAYYAVETGPISTRWITERLREGGSDALAAGLDRRPLAIPFLNLREEADAATPFARAEKLWGIDQEFIGSPLLHLDWLAERGDGAARALAQDWLSKERIAFATGNQAQMMMMAASDEDWESLSAAFAEDDAARERIEAMAESARVYRHYMAGRGLDNNLDRIEMIKASFLDQYHAAAEAEGAPPRVLMKMGATHAGKGTSSMSTFDVGSLLPGMAAANRMTSLHIAYLPLDGEQLSVRPSTDGMFRISPAANEKLEAALAAAGVDIAAIDEGHHVIALEPVKRALGNAGLAELDRDTRFTILGFDYLVTTRGATPGVPLAR